MPKGKHQFHRVIVVPIALIVLLAVAVFWILDRIQLHVNDRLASSLQAVLSTTDKALDNWAEQTEVDVAVLANSSKLREGVERQLQVPRNSKALTSSPALKEIRQAVAPALDLTQFPSFAVIAPDDVQIAAELDETVGIKDSGAHNHDVLVRAMAGKTTLGLPFRSSLLLDENTRRQYPVMTAGAPIHDEKGNVIAALALRLDPRRDFTRAARLGRLESTGETYAFDRSGRLVTESRFEDQLRKAGLIPRDADSILNLEIRDPGGNTIEGYKPRVPRDQQPLTRAAQSAIEGRSGMDLQGYRDYRGVPVIGAWLWDNQLGMGLATEMEVAEAFTPYHRVRELVIALLFLTAAVSFALFLIIRHRERLIASNTTFQHAVQARDDMMAIVSHDLKNPINTILLRSHVLIQMLETRPGEIDPIKNNLHMLQRTARHMNQLIGDLTDVARIQAGHLDVDLQECTVEDAVEPALERVRLLAREKEIEFFTTVVPGLPRIAGDMGRITQVLDNLLGNALKFTPKGGKITVTAARLQGDIQVSVADTGPGIPGEALGRIFEPYWQMQKTRSGMGLGLFIARTLVEAHGGRMWVDSTVGRGTTFYFTLPALDLRKKVPA
ncbi:MAG TPA: sensor histidine kinase [Terriglobia bacterium]|jgi:signal transduction histidine kinase